MNFNPNSSGIPKLIYDSAKHRSNVSEVEKSLNFFVQQRFTTLHDCISTRTLRDILEPKPPSVSMFPPPASSTTSSSSSKLRSGSAKTAPSTTTTSTSSDPSDPADSLYINNQMDLDIEVAVYTEKYKQYLTKMGKREEELSQLYGVVDELLSVTSKEKIIAHSDFDATSVSRNGSALWNIVFETHQIIDMFRTPSQKLEMAQRSYYGLQQTSGMSLEMYFERFKENLKSFTQLKIELPTPAVQAVSFLTGLNKVYYAELSHQLINLPHFNMIYPADLTSAYNLAVNYVPSRVAIHSSTERNVFNTSGKSNIKKKKTPSPVSVPKPPSFHPPSASPAPTSSGPSSGLWCKYCKKTTHVVEDCEKLKLKHPLSFQKKEVALMESVPVMEFEYIPSTFEFEININEVSYHNPNLVLLDTCAQVSIFKNGDLLQNVTPIKQEVSISGLSRSSVSIQPKLQGQLPGFEDVTIYISPETKRNILCYADVVDHYPTSIQDKTFVVESSKGNVIFSPCSKVIATLFPVKAEVSSSSMTTIPPPSWTKEEMSRAELVRTCMSRLAFESHQSLILAVRHGSISNLPFTIRDISNAVKIFGPCVASLKGKSTAHPTAISDAIEIDKLEEKQQSLQLDIFYFHQIPFLVLL